MSVRTQAAHLHPTGERLDAEQVREALQAIVFAALGAIAGCEMLTLFLIELSRI